MKNDVKTKIAKRTIWLLESIFSWLFLVMILLMLSYGMYSLWDTKQVYEEADATVYAEYKPIEEDGGLSFRELQGQNAEVFAWLTVYGTNIDYPVVQAEDNEKYVYTDVMGDYRMTGSIFIDYRNTPQFTDFNTIFYGHHMAESAMFGDIGNFAEKEYFDSRQYGNLYVDGKNYGIEFFAFLDTDAYDNYVFFTPATTQEEKEKSLEHWLQIAKHTRDIDVSIDDNIVLLSTCNTTGDLDRQVLVGKITDEPYPIPEELLKFEVPRKKAVRRVDDDSFWARLQNIPLSVVLIVGGVILLVVVLTIVAKVQRKNRYKAALKNIVKGDEHNSSE